VRQGAGDRGARGTQVQWAREDGWDTERVRANALGERGGNRL
jgi:hypothetical protein